jgi:hypothetical protein
LAQTAERRNNGLPTSSFDTFFACTIILAAALIATGFVTSTMQLRIDNTKSINEQSYLQAIADHIITSPGTPSNWGTSGSVPADFGLAVSPSTSPYELDIDKVSRLNSLNDYSISYFDMETASKLNSIALGIAVSQIMDVNIEQSSSSTTNNNASFTLSILTSVDSEPVSASLNCYAVADNYLNNITGSTSDTGLGNVTVQIPTAAMDNAMAIVFARASFDDRITSYAIFNLSNSTQETLPTSEFLTLSPIDYKLSFSTNSSELIIQNGYVFSYSYRQNLAYTPGAMQCAIPEIVDKSPLIIVVYGFNNGTYFQQWVSYPQVPFNAGSNFSGSQQNVFSYTVTINGVLYKLNISLGGVAS